MRKFKNNLCRKIKRKYAYDPLANMKISNIENENDKIEKRLKDVELKIEIIEKKIKKCDLLLEKLNKIKEKLEPEIKEDKYWII